MHPTPGPPSNPHSMIEISKSCTELSPGLHLLKPARDRDCLFSFHAWDSLWLYLFVAAFFVILILESTSSRAGLSLGVPIGGPLTFFFLAFAIAGVPMLRQHTGGNEQFVQLTDQGIAFGTRDKNTIYLDWSSVELVNIQHDAVYFYLGTMRTRYFAVYRRADTTGDMSAFVQALKELKVKAAKKRQ